MLLWNCSRQMDGALDKRGGQTENDLEQGFVKHLLNSV